MKDNQYPRLNIICIITARGNSQRLKNKNLKIINNKPLIYWSINSAKNSKLVNKVIVSSEDDKILRYSKKLDVQTVKRPKRLSNSIIMPDAALVHAVSSIKEKIDLIVFLHPTSPLRKKDDIDNSIKILIGNNYDSLLTVNIFKKFIWHKKKNSAFPINYNYLKRPRSQEFENYCENGSIYVFKKKILNKNKNRLGGKIGLMIQEDWQFCDINNSDDFKEAESIMKKYIKKIE